MRVRLLGSVDVVVDDVPRPVRGPRRKAVLAALALHPGEIVSTDRLVDIVWGDAAPAAAAVTLQSHLSHLRRVLGDQVAIIARAPGYLLDLGGGATDVQIAQDLIDRGTRSSDPGRAASLLHEAIGLWRDRPLADLTGLAWFDEHAQRLERLLHRARHALIDARLALGQHTQLVAELPGLARQDPHNEQIHGQLMLALYRAGRQGDALATYQRLRRTLDEDLGIGPSRPLRDLEAAILRQDPALDPPPPPVTAPSAGAADAVPAQLPMAPAGFIGRVGELAALDRLIGGAEAVAGGEAAPQPAAVVISAVSGTAGIGKTALAVYWAHRVAARFPDGQLYVNLRGFDPAGTALEPVDALREFLYAFGVPVERIPAGLADQAALYRSLMAGRRVLVVLDNARDAEQVRPLLPASAGCLALVTSRGQLGGLVVTEGAHPLTLDLLTLAEARDLLTRRLGAARVATEPGAVDEIIARCARLPLALAIAAARAATHPSFPLAALAAELGEATGGLDALRGGDPATDVRAVFSWSYRTLSTDGARLFRLLGLHTGPHISMPATASLAAVPPHQARALLAELTGAHLLTEHADGRYTLHDLLCAYATDQAKAHGGDDRSAAQRRIVEHYLHTTHAAALLLYPRWDRIALAAPAPGVRPETLASHDHALAWFTAEHPVLLATVLRAAADGFDDHAWQLAWTCTAFLLRRGYWDDQIVIQRVALEAARRTGDAVGQGHALRGMALAHVRWGGLDAAGAQYQRALDAYAGGDPTGEANAHMGLAEVAEKQGRPAAALGHARQGLDLFRATGDAAGQAHALNGVGWCHTRLGDHRQALAYCTEALSLVQRLGDREGEANTWDSLGHIHTGLADYARAVACFQRSVDLCRDVSDSYNEADTLVSLGDTHLAAGDPDAAHGAWHRALDIFEQLSHPDAELVRARLGERVRRGATPG